MEQYVRDLVSQHRRGGVLVDTNLLLLFFVGSYDRALVERFSRTADRFVSEDYDVLASLLGEFARIVTTPHVLTETSNLMGGLSGRAKAECFAWLARSILEMRETHVAAADLAQRQPFVKFGLTDTSIMEVAAAPYLMLTDGWPLYNRLTSSGLDALNFNHLRPL